MKIRNKIALVLALFVLFSIAFCLNNVKAVGRVAQGWMVLDENGQRAMLYRTYTTPYSGILDDYEYTTDRAKTKSYITDNNGNIYNYETESGKSKNSQWIYYPKPIPVHGSYATVWMWFHDKMMCDYSSEGDGKWAYNKADENAIVSLDLSTVSYAYENSERVVATPKRLTDAQAFYLIERYGSTFVEKDRGTGAFVENIDKTKGTITEYRYGIVKLNNKNIYIGDNIIYEEDLEGIIAQASYNEKYNASTCYVSLAQISQSYGTTPIYEVSETSYDFMNQYNKTWGDTVHGKTDNALGSAFNLYDNLLIFPQMGQFTVYVRHIDIGTEKVINAENSQNGTIIKQEPNKQFMYVDGKLKAADGANEKYSEIYKGIPITSDLKKLPLQEDELKALGLEGKKYIGHTFGLATSTTEAEENNDFRLENNIIDTVPEFELSGGVWWNADNYIVVDFYYSSEEKEPDINLTEKEPEKDIDGKVFVKSSENIQGQCIDTGNGLYIQSVPSGTNATVGIDNIPQYMAGAITLQPQKVEDKVTYNINITSGLKSETITYNLYYTINYYNITNMLIYKYNGIKIKDASGTDSIFNWANRELTDNALIKTPTVKLTGLNNTSIENNSTSINKSNNYYKIEFVSNKGVLDVTNTKAGTLNITLSSSEFNNIDTDNNGEISYSELANWLELEARVQVQNMNVNIDGNTLYENNLKVEKGVKFNNSITKSVEISTGVPDISKTKYDNLTGENITKTSYTNKNRIDRSILNGVRALSGTTNYVTVNVIGNEKSVIDTVYYNKKNTGFRVELGKIFSKEYKVDVDATTVEAKYKQVEPVNIYTPITVKSTIEIDKNDVIDQTSDKSSTPLLQMNTPFKVKITSDKSEGIYNFTNTQKYSAGYYIKFDFDVYKVKVDGSTYNGGEKVTAGTWLGFFKTNNKGYVEISAEAYSEDANQKTVAEEKSSYTVRAVAYNATELMRTTSKLYPTLKDLVNSEDKELVDNICSTPSYFAEETNQIMIINRMYDFRVTDVKDVEWKNTFRTTVGNNVNKHTGILYNSGTTKWDTSVVQSSNKIVNRPTSEIGRNPVRILPIGPYKNTDITKLKAPKLGYRLSFDLKVTGSYYTSTGDVRTDKKVDIQTKFYYISKDGKTFIEESTGGEGIYLFYKNSSGKYVRIDNAGGGYNLKFTPQDGYRYIESSDIKNLVTTSVSLGNLRNLTLKYNMATPTDNKDLIIYYGEYKLPNSTIAVKVDKNGKYDINKPLTDGYIGVIFNISATAGTVTQNGVQKPVVLNYSQNTKDDPNTSQWDYEGFLGFTNYGNSVKAGEISLKLEKGLWQITDSIYNKIKGTVILYDIDERAATDFE